MKQKMKKTERKTEYRWNNKGMSLVTVIIAIGFVSILVSILLMVSMINFKMKQVNAYAKDSFYSAEQVLDEINVGLQKDISDALSSAYEDIMTNYGSNEYDTERKNTILQTKYYEYLWELLEKDNAHKTYDTATLYSYLKTTTQWRGAPEDGYGAILRSVDGAGTEGTTGVMVTYDNKGIILKNLSVYYKDRKGFISKIQTDIRLDYPKFDFAASTVLPDVPEYAFIADSGMKTTAMGGGEIVITGNVYADSVDAAAADSNNKIKLTQKGTGKFFVKNALELKNAAFSNETDGEFWAKDVLVDSSNLTLLGESNVADDINIKGDSSTVKLGGIYNGFGNSLTDAAQSSAILVNGADATLDLSEITKITLAGHAYVGTSKKNVGAVGGTTGNQGNNVYTGESLAIKSNQLMYLVPPECIGVMKATGKSVYLKNPLTAAEYNAIHNKAEITEVSGDVITSVLGESLSSYVQTAEGIVQAEKVFIPTADASQTLVYYYIKFVDENAANRYFAKYYNANKESIDRYMSFYAKEIKFPNTDSLLRLRLAGNSIAGTKEAGYTSQTTGISGASSKFESNAAASDKEFSAICTKLIKNYSELTNLTYSPDKDNQIVFENIVDTEKLKSYIDKSPTKAGNTASFTGEVDGKNVTAVLSKDSYTITDGNIHLVIADGDVTVAINNYTGTIIANGTVTVTGSAGKMSADAELVKTMLHFSQTVGEEVYPLAGVLKDGSDFMYSSLAEGTESDSVSLSKLVVYENWTKE